MQSYTITLKDCSVGYDGHSVLQNLNATLPAGKISVILGCSGSGKSTLLRHIVGLSRPISGKILLGETDFFALSTREFRRMRRRMGMLFQDGALLGALSLLDNVALPIREHTKLADDVINSAVLRALRLVGLEDFANYYPGQLSGGMRKRAGLARAIIVEPPLLFCDEPTSGLDPITAAQMDGLLLAMKKNFPAMTMVVVSHDLNSLERIADYVLVLHEGQAIFSGSLAELKNTEDKFLQAFLERKPMQSADAAFEAQDAQVSAALEKWMQE